MDTIKKIFENPIARNAMIGLGIFFIAIIIIIMFASCSGKNIRTKN